MPDTLTFSEAEAALMLSTLVAFSDDNPSEAEGVILRTYYRHETAEGVQKKLDSAGYLYPRDIRELQPVILEELKKADRTFQLRTIAVSLLLARADGTIAPEEISLLQECAGALGIGLAEAQEYAESGLHEIDETGAYHRNPPVETARELLDLSAAEATVLLSSLVAFADDDPSDAEAAVLREHFSEETVERALRKATEAGYRYPDDLALLKPSIFEALDQFNRQNQLKSLAVAYRTAGADGTVDRVELQIIQEFCERYFIGMAEIDQFFKATPA